MKKIIPLFLTLVLALTACATNPAVPSVQPTYTPLPTYTPYPTQQAAVQPTAQPTQAIQPTVPAQPTAVVSVPTQVVPVNQPSSGPCAFAEPGDPDLMDKTVIELVPLNTWFHRVFDVRLFNQANNWGGADSWFVSLALGPNSGGNWISWGNPGEIIYRANQTTSSWCLGVLTTSTWKSQFMGNTSMPAAINVKVKEEWPVNIQTASGKLVTQNTSDGGDITIILPDDGTVYIWVTVTTNAPTFESRIHWGPYDRSDGINTVHGEN